MNGEVQEVVVIPQDLVTLVFNGTVAANSAKTLCSKYVTTPFTTERFRVHFALNTNKLLRIKFFVSPDDSTPTAEPLTGHPILAVMGHVDYLVGDDETVEIPYRTKYPDRGLFIKVFADNRDSFAHSIDAQVFLSLTIPKEE